MVITTVRIIYAKFWRRISISFSYFQETFYFKAWINKYAFTPMTQQPLMCQGLLFIEAFWPPSLDTRQPVGLLWASNQSDIETDRYRQHKTLTRQTYARPSGIQTYNLCRWAQAEPRLRPRSHRDRQHVHTDVLLTVHHIAYISIIKPKWWTFHSIYWESRVSTCFEHYLLILRWRSNGIWYIACVCQLAVVRLQRTIYIYMDLRLATLKAVSFYFLHNVSTLNQ
jgi:hypothetical protein